ncbi:MAG: hypothetical protein ABH833_01930 [Parcubacteria group bacterium]
MYDVPETIAGAVRAMRKRFSPHVIYIHKACGRDSIQAARHNCGSSEIVLAREGI